MSTLQSVSVTTSITALSHDGRGIAHVKGKTTFIENALPGEKVAFVYTKQRGKFDEGKTVEVLEASVDRAQPACAHFGVCGGCSLQHMTSAAQLAYKQKTFLEQLQHFGKVQPKELLPPLTGPIWGYRRKARLGVKYVVKKNALLVGFREKNNHFLADIKQCETLHPAVGYLIEALKELIADLSVYQQLPQVEVAIDDQETALIFRHMVDISDDDKNKLIIFAQQHQIRMYLQPNKPNPIHLLWPQDGRELLSYQLPDFDVTLQFHPSGFTQINTEINRQMVRQAVQLLGLDDKDCVLDLFCGVGNFTLPIARHCAEVIGMEGDADLIKQAQQNAQNNQISNANFYQADLTQSLPLDKIKKCNKLLLDPPRTGALEVIQQLKALRVERIVYVSCNPATLARDAGELVQQGYRLASAGIMDMFPHTHHVEAMAVFEKNPNRFRKYFGAKNGVDLDISGHRAPHEPMEFDE
jgi:23S rRNA (uracil1939-C5)-methyltransferase